MGLWSAIKNLDANYLFVDEDAVRTTEAVQSAQDKLVKERYEMGRIPETKAQALLADIGAGRRNLYDEEFAKEGNSPLSVLKEELINRLPDNLRRSIDNFLKTAVGGIFRSIPWYVWVLGLAIGGGYVWWRFFRGRA